MYVCILFTLFYYSKVITYMRKIYQITHSYEQHSFLQVFYLEFYHFFIFFKLILKKFDKFWNQYTYLQKTSWLQWLLLFHGKNSLFHVSNILKILQLVTHPLHFQKMFFLLARQLYEIHVHLLSDTLPNNVPNFYDSVNFSSWSCKKRIFFWHRRHSFH